MNESFDIKIDSRDLIAKFRRLADRSADMRPANNEIGALLVASITENFETGGRFRAPGDWRGGSRRWRPLSTVTIFGGRKKGFFKKRGGGLTQRGEKKINRKALVDTGRLVNSINFRAGRAEVEVGTSVIYAGIHQFGGRAGRGRTVRIPARPFLVVQKRDLDEIDEILEKHLLEGF